MKNLIKRLKNLWKLSSLDLSPGIYEVRTNLDIKRKQAEIIKKNKSLDFYDENNSLWK